jgi:cyanophycinase
MRKPKGKLLIIGGAEDLGAVEPLDIEANNIKFKRYEILKELLSMSKKSVVVITTASRIHHEVREAYCTAFDKLYYTQPRFVHIRDSEEANDERILDDIRDASAVFFTGGDQSRLTSILNGTKVIDLIKQRYTDDPEFLIAGTSAGSMALSDIMITGGGTEEAIISKKLLLSPGLGIINDCIIDTHFIKRGRIGRLIHAILLHPDRVGIGLGENTALIIKNGEKAQCRGSGMVMLVDARNITKTNIDTAQKGEPIFAENIKIHVLVQGNRFSFKTHKIIR